MTLELNKNIVLKNKILRLYKKYKLLIDNEIQHKLKPDIKTRYYTLEIIYNDLKLRINNIKTDINLINNETKLYNNISIYTFNYKNYNNFI